MKGRNNIDKEDEILKKFFVQNKQEITDNGFSRKVMSKLPEQKNLDWIVWLFAATGMAITIYIILTLQIEIYFPAYSNAKMLLFLFAGVFVIPVLLCSVLKVVNVNCLTFIRLRELFPQF